MGEIKCFSLVPSINGNKPQHSKKMEKSSKSQSYLFPYLSNSPEDSINTSSSSMENGDFLLKIPSSPTPMETSTISSTPLTLKKSWIIKMSRDLGKASQEKHSSLKKKPLIKEFKNLPNMPLNCLPTTKPAVSSEPRNTILTIPFQTGVMKVVRCRTRPKNFKNHWLSPRSNSFSIPLTVCPLPTTSRCTLAAI